MAIHYTNRKNIDDPEGWTACTMFIAGNSNSPKRRKRLAVTREATEVTCKKCLKELDKRS